MSWIVDQDQLHITIGSSPTVQTSGHKINVKTELLMVKAALLYADHTTLCSPVAAIFAEFAAMQQLSTSQKVAFFEYASAWYPDAEEAKQAKDFVEGYRRAWSRRYSKQGQLYLRKFEKALEEIWPKLSDDFRGAVSKLGGDEIVSAAESGLVNIHRFEVPKGQSLLDSDTVIDEYVSVVGATISDRSTYPLFDEQTNSIISSGINEGFIPVSEFGIARGQEIGLAADLFQRLPLFPEASVNEILDIREELSSALLGFRSAMLKFSREIKHASWDNDFSLAAESIFRQELAPAILNIEEEIRSNRFLMELAQRLVPAAGVGLSALAVSMSNLPNAALAALAMGATAGTATIIQAYREWAEKRRAATQNQLYFYYKAGQLLEHGTYEYVKE
jgi:hypothetical protein